MRKPDDFIAWRLKLETWWQAHSHLTKERTYDRFRWWFTHDRLRKAWHLLARLSGNGTLFTYVSHGNARTTSPLEGGINSGLRHVLRAHRGMTEAHVKRAAEWFLTLHEIPIDHAHELIPNPATISVIDHDADADELPEQSLYDTGLTAEEGLWTRTGWAGRA